MATTSTDQHRIETVEQLREVIAEPIPEIASKVSSTIDHRARAYLAKAPFLVLSTADAGGNIDASPKGDEPGFVLVEDERTLVIPDRPGNKLAMGLRNILDNPHVGILFMIPGTNETVRVNGRAELTNDPELLDRLAARGKPAVIAIRVHVEECFFHCAKAFLRSKLWKAESWPEKHRISFGEMFAERMGADDDSKPQLAATIDELIEQDYCDNL
jgi:PPOX class probable FMN-dependent enzyme